MTSINPVTSRVTHRSSLEIVPFVPCNQVDNEGLDFILVFLLSSSLFFYSVLCFFLMASAVVSNKSRPTAFHPAVFSQNESI